MANMSEPTLGMVNVDGAVVNNTPGSGTVTVMVSVEPLASLTTNDAVPEERPVMESVESVTSASLATEGLLLATPYGFVPPEMAKMFVVPLVSVRFAGAVLDSAPGAGTVTVMVVVAPLESLTTSVDVPLEMPLIVKTSSAVLTIDALATAGLPFLTA